MNRFVSVGGVQTVALLTEGVDRNIRTSVATAILAKSPSSRRAWIEMLPPEPPLHGPPGRPPHGGRG